jgi:NAD(P)-dependent dehydrogenase (short-subunit alcohol dehydrogenase family)
MSKFDLDGKVCVVTGGGGSIGSQTCRELASGGGKIVVTGRTQATLDAVVDQITSEGQEAMAIVCDITNPDQVDNLVSETVKAFGSLDVLVNNAGGSWSRHENAEDTPYDKWLTAVDINLNGAFLCSMAAGKQMIEQQSGRIINVASTAGTKGNPYMLAYSAAKAGMISLSNNLAFMWKAHNIYVNVILPGAIAPAGTVVDDNVPPLELRPGTEHVANMIRFLAAPASDMITGEAIPVRAWFKSDRFWQ